MVNTVDAVYAHLGAERLMRRIVFGHHQQTAGILIDAVYDAGADRAADAGQLPGTVVKQCIDESAVRVAGGRVNHHALRLVDHQQVIILVHNIKRNVLGLRLNGLRVGQCHTVNSTGGYLVFFVDGRAVPGDKPLLDQPLQRTAGECRALPRQPRIQPTAVAGDGGKLKQLHRHPPFALRSPLS